MESDSEDNLNLIYSESEGSSRGDNKTTLAKLESDSEEGVEGLSAGNEIWGKGKSTYYEQDDLLTSDEEKLENEENEISLLRRKENRRLNEKDFDVDSDDEEAAIYSKLQKTESAPIYSEIYGSSQFHTSNQIHKRDRPITIEQQLALNKPDKIIASIASPKEINSANGKKFKINQEFADSVMKENSDDEIIEESRNTEESMKKMKVEESDDCDERRRITKEIYKNSGMKRLRNRKFKHSRTKTREKWRKTQIKAKGIRPVYKPLEGHYLGEKTGIKDNLIKSINLN